MPKRRTAIIVQPPADSGVAGWPMINDIDEEWYVKPDAGRLLCSPADETPCEPCDVQPDEFDVAICADRIETAFDFPIRRIESRWAGLRSFAPDKTPVAGFDPRAPGFFWLAGQGGYGIQTAPALAALAAALIQGEGVPARLAAIDPAALAPDRLLAAGLGRVVEDDAQRVPAAAAHPAHAMAQAHAVAAARAAHRPLVDGEHHGIALAQRHHLDPRLLARALLGQHELAAGEVAPGLGQQDRHLQREDMLAVEILVQAVEVAGPVLQQQRRRPRLTGGVALARGTGRSRSGKRRSWPNAACQRFATSARGG